MTNSFSVSEVLFSLQDKMTIQGTIASEHRSFYSEFRKKLEDVPTDSTPETILELLNQTRSEAEEKFTDDEFNGFADAVLSKVERVDDSQVKSETVATVDLEAVLEVASQDAPSLPQETAPSRSILSRFQSLSVGVLAIIGAATVLSIFLFYLTL